MVYTNKQCSSRASRSIRNTKYKSKSKSKSKQMKSKQMKSRTLKGGYSKNTHMQQDDGNMKPIMHKGGSSCSNEGVGTSSPKSETFKTYLNNLNTKLDMPLKGGGRTLKPSTAIQSAGGYTTDPSKFIAGMPEYVGYDDWAPPSLINGTLQMGSGNKPVCGAGAMRGGNKTQGARKSKASRKSHKYKARGGYKSSKPIDYDSAFNGSKGVFAYPDDMNKRTYDELQPNYSVNAV